MTQNEEVYPASSKFESYDDLMKSVREFYFAKGYGLSIRDSKKDKYVTLQCDRGGSYRDIRGIGDKRKRKTTSRLTECPFQIDGKKLSDGSWIFKAKNLSHNHEASDDISGHPSFRRLPPADVQSVKHMSLSGITPRQILSSLRQETPNLPANSRTIYNLKEKIRRESLGNRSVISALFEELAKGGFSYDILHNQEGHITRLLIAHPLSIKLAKVFSNIYVMDCTYKTNRYDMPFLNIVGVSCFNTTFFVGFVFLEREDEENYVWALNAFKKILGHANQPNVIMTDRELALMNGIKEVFPAATSLLCAWHIEKNVLANCKKHFERAEEFNVCAWTEKYLHLGSRTSARVEGAHAKLKLYLQVSTGGFQEVKEKICLAVEHEFNEIKVKLASERIKVPHNCNTPLFRELLYNVSQFALNEIYKQYEKIKEGTMNHCSGHFTATMGLPCVHKIANWQGTSLSLDLIHPQWRIDTFSLNSNDDSVNDGEEKFAKLLDELYSKYKAWPISKKEFATSMVTKLLNESDTFFEIMIQRPKGRPPTQKKKRGITSTTREPSKFELVESSRARNPSRSTRVVQNNDEVHGGSSLIDLNAYPDCRDDIISFS